MILEPKKIKSNTVSTVSPSICHEVMGPDAMILVFYHLRSLDFGVPLWMSLWSSGSTCSSCKDQVCREEATCPVQLFVQDFGCWLLAHSSIRHCQLPPLGGTVWGLCLWGFIHVHPGIPFFLLAKVCVMKRPQGSHSWQPAPRPPWEVAEAAGSLDQLAGSRLRSCW